MQQQGPLPPWLFLVMGVMGVFLARGGFTADLMCTISDSMRTLAMLAVIVFGCFMVFKDLNEVPQPIMRRVAPPPSQPMVTMSAQQFKLLLDMASPKVEAIKAPENPTAPAVVPDEVTAEITPVVISEVVASEVVASEVVASTETS